MLPTFSCWQNFPLLQNILPAFARVALNLLIEQFMQQGSARSGRSVFCFYQLVFPAHGSLLGCCQIIFSHRLRAFVSIFSSAYFPFSLHTNSHKIIASELLENPAASAAAVAAISFVSFRVFPLLCDKSKICHLLNSGQIIDLSLCLPASCLHHSLPLLAQLLPRPLE